MDRHDLAYLHSTATLHFLDATLAEVAKQKVQQLLSKQVPMTICRQDQDDLGQVKLAINCMVDGYKYRVACLVGHDDIADINRPISLAKLLTTGLIQAPALHSLVVTLQQLSCEVYVYGSFAYEYLTQDRYVRSTSDLDLVLYPQDLSKLNEILQAIQQVQALSDIRLDGEIKIHPQWHVSFNELMMIFPNMQQSMIGKGIQQVAMLKLEQLLEWNLDDVFISTSTR